MQLFSHAGIALRFACFICLAAPGSNSLLGDDSWKEEALLLYNSGSPEINDLRARSTGDTRLGTYAEALGLLFREPREEENVIQAKAVFDQLFEVDSNDDVGAASAYYLARINHRHLAEPDIESARMAYRYLFEFYPRRFFGELALLKFALIELYEIDSDQPIEERLAELEKRGARLTIPEMRRGFHRSMGEAYRVYELSVAEAYKHLKTAYDIKGAMPETQVELMLAVAELAETLGNTEDAISALQDFLKTATWDDRREEVAARLAALRSLDR